MSDATPPQLKKDRPIDDWKAELFHDVDAAFTHHLRPGIAETGTLIVWPDADEPRAMSLVPPVHIALFDAATIHPTLADAVSTEVLGQRPADQQPVDFGPSKPPIIQQTLAGRARPA